MNSFMATTLFSNLTEGDKNAAIEKLITESTPSDDFFLLIILSVLMATFGLIINDTAVVIGSMLIAPILSPALSLSLGLVTFDVRLIGRAAFTLLKAVIFAILASTLLAYLLRGGLTEGLTTEILARTEVTLISVGIALIAGVAAAFALAKPHLSASIPGIAISVALIPPLSVIGIGLARLDFTVAGGAYALFIINLLAIVLVSLGVFALMGFGRKQRVAEKAVKKEDQKMKREEKKAEKIAAEVPIIEAVKEIVMPEKK